MTEDTPTNSDDATAPVGAISAGAGMSSSSSSRFKRLIIFLVAIATFMCLSLFSGSENELLKETRNQMIGGSISNRTAITATTSSMDNSVRFQLRQQNTRSTGSTIARTYPVVPSSQWCIDGSLRYDQEKRRPMGLCYVKLPKAASSTLAGINKRIARNYARRQQHSNNDDNKGVCIRHDGHQFGMYYKKRILESSFLWTMVRDPAKRALSRVAYTMSGSSGNDDPHPSALYDPRQVIQALKTTDEQFGTVSMGRGGFQLQYTMLTIIDEWSAWNSTFPNLIINPELIKQHVAQVINGYNFIGIIERLDESLVALQLLLGLDTSDILYMSSKVHGTYDRRPIMGNRQSYECVKLASFNTTKDDKELSSKQIVSYVTSDEWFAKNYGDYLLYHAANISLDRTIVETIGLPKFAKALKEYRNMQHLAQRHCHNKVFYPCSTNGIDQIELSNTNCLSNDEACGYKCMYEVYRMRALHDFVMLL